MRISDWSSDVCSSDLCNVHVEPFEREAFNRSVLNRARERSIEHYAKIRVALAQSDGFSATKDAIIETRTRPLQTRSDRMSVVEGKSLSVRVVIGGRRIINKQNIISIKYSYLFI